jgi:hypothetical protein
MWKWVPIAVLLASGADGGPEAALAELAPPPWTPSHDERPSTDYPAFATCLGMVEMLAVGMGRVTDRRFSSSPEFGDILRARVATVTPDKPALVTCWFRPGKGASIIADMGPLPRE